MLLTLLRPLNRQIKTQQLPLKAFSYFTASTTVSNQGKPQPPSHHQSNEQAPLIVWKALPSTSRPLSPKLIIRSLGELSKFKLSALVVLTTLSGNLMAVTGTSSVDPGHLALTLMGTALCSFSANTFNQWAESPLDSQMPRTQNRPLPRLIFTPFAAFNWALLTGGVGLGILGWGVNTVAAGLAGATIAMYAGVYTPLKRISILNTWVGALVGAIPPLIGWAAACPVLTPSAFILPAVLFCWQFPHFNALSWNLRAEYARAGYRMTSVINPLLNARVALRYSLALVPITLAATPLGVSLTTSTFALTGNIVNLPLIWLALQFWSNPSRRSARFLFFASLFHLPVFLTLLFVHKNNKIDSKLYAYVT